MAKRIATLWLVLICSACATHVTLDQVMTDPGRYRGVPKAGTVARVTGQIYDAYDVRSLPLPLPDDLRKGVILLESSSRTGPP